MDYGNEGRAVADLYQSGLSAGAVARQCNISRAKVMRMLVQTNTPRRTGTNQYSLSPYTPEKTAAATAMYASGLSTHAIAARTYTSQERVSRMLKYAGVTLRHKNSPSAVRKATISIDDGMVRPILTEAEIAELYGDRTYG